MLMIDYVDYVDVATTDATVLVVEGDAPVRVKATKMIAGAGYRVIEASNAAVALRLMAQGIVPDVLVTDVKMSGSIDGFALAHIVATRWPRTGILIHSDQAQPRPGDMPAGAVFLHKPCLPKLLLDQVAALCPAAEITGA